MSHTHTKIISICFILGLNGFFANSFALVANVDAEAQWILERYIERTEHDIDVSKYSDTTPRLGVGGNAFKYSITGKIPTYKWIKKYQVVPHAREKVVTCREIHHTVHVINKKRKVCVVITIREPYQPSLVECHAQLVDEEDMPVGSPKEEPVPNSDPMGSVRDFIVKQLTSEALSNSTASPDLLSGEMINWPIDAKREHEDVCDTD